jgi:sugar phosphate permease
VRPQAFTWPALALILSNFFGRQPGYGTLYSLFSTNQNLGSAATPLLLAAAISTYGWRVALWGPAAVTGLYTLLLALLLTDAPVGAGCARAAPLPLAPVSHRGRAQRCGCEAGRRRHQGVERRSEGHAAHAQRVGAQPGCGAARRRRPSVDARARAFCANAGYALITALRVGVNDWSLLFLRQHGALSAEAARDCLVANEAGGFVGGLAGAR